MQLLHSSPAPLRAARSQRQASRPRSALFAAAAKPGDDVPPGYGDTFPPPAPQRRAGVLLHPTSLPVRARARTLGSAHPPPGPLRHR